MNTSVFTVVLTGALLAGQGGSPTWQNDYHKAQQMGASQKKPLAIVFGSGANGWTKIAKEATPAAGVSQVLTQSYVCVYVDTATPAGKKIAGDFGITQSTGLVISDRSASLQAFWHQGDMTSQNLETYLRRFADPAVVVRTTETASTTRTSFYPSENSSEVNWGSSSPVGSSSYCPSCNNVRGRR